MKTLFSSLLALAGVAALIGCGGSGTTVATPTANVRIVHASPDAPNVDVRLGGTVAFTNVPYFSAGVRSVNAGANRVQVNPAGSGTSVIDVSPTLAANRLYTILAVSRVASIEPLVVDDPDSGPGAGSARVRFVHGAPSVGSVDIYVTAPGAALPATPNFAGVPFKGVSTAVTVPAGNYQVRITPAGTPGTVAIDTGTLALGSNTSTVAVALEAAGGGTPLTARTYTKSY